MPPPIDPVPPEPKKETPPQAGPAPLDPKSLLLPKKETGPTPQSAMRVNAGALLAQEESATLLKPEPKATELEVSVAPAPAAPSEDDVKPLQTYRSDIEKVVNDGSGASTVSIAAAEANRRSQQPLNEAPASEPFNFRSWGMIAGGIVLVLLAIGALAFVFLRPGGVPGSEPPSAPFIFVDDAALVPVIPGERSRPALMDSLQAMRSRVSLSTGLIAWLYVAEESTDPETPAQELPIQELLGTLAPQMPPAMLRVLAGPYLVGVHSFDENQPFILLQVDSYETAYAGMLEWERTLQADLSPLFVRTPSPRLPTDTSTTTASSTPQQFLPTNFVDKVVENRDVRLIQNDAGDILLLWTFLGRNTLLITTNEYTLREVLSRLKAAPVVPNPGQ